MVIRVAILLLFAIHLILSFLVVDVTLQNLQRKNITIYVASWNVHNNLGKESDSNLQTWLCANGNNPPDIYVVGFQELTDRDGFEAVLLILHDRIKDTSTVDKSLANLCGAKYGNTTYREVTSSRLEGMQLTVFVRIDFAQNILKSSTHHVDTGVDLLVTKLGNKGGLGVSLLINDAWICFVNSHLASGDDKSDDRDKNQREIEEKMKFGYKDLPDRKIYDHNKIIWIGDLNYRVDKPLRDNIDWSTVDIMGIIREKDQLYAHMRDNKVFLGYREGDIKFKPTYKYDVGTDDWDTSDKKRNPAWCDRILWKGDGFHQSAYTSVSGSKISDHKPIYGIFQVELNVKV